MRAAEMKFCQSRRKVVLSQVFNRVSRESNFLQRQKVARIVFEAGHGREFVKGQVDFGKTPHRANVEFKELVERQIEFLGPRKCSEGAFFNRGEAVARNVEDAHIAEAAELDRVDVDDGVLGQLHEV